MATFSKFNCFVEDLGRKIHNLNADTLKIMLTNSAPSASNTVDGNITEITAANGYSAGGATVASNAYTQTSGTGKLTGNAVTYTATTGGIATFRYMVLYNATAGSASNRPLIGWWDQAATVTLANDGDKFTFGKDSAGANWDSTTPILSIT
jgi:hypothetical protein